MPVNYVQAPVVDPASGTASALFHASWPGQATAFTLVAIDEHGAETVIATELRASLSGGMKTVNFDPIDFDGLPSGTYTFRVDANNLIAHDVSSGESAPIFVCFLEGTMIRTPAGDVPVETLRRGDLVTTQDGRDVPVLFVGRQTVVARFAGADRARPVLIRAGALGEMVPQRDLIVSPAHGVVVDGVLAHALALVNDTTILRIDAPAERFTYYSVELERHEVLIAEGAPCESFSDHVDRKLFDNASDFAALYPEGRRIGEMDLPLVKSHRQLPADTRARLAGAADRRAA